MPLLRVLTKAGYVAHLASIQEAVCSIPNVPEARNGGTCRESVWHGVLSPGKVGLALFPPNLLIYFFPLSPSDWVGRYPA